MAGDSLIQDHTPENRQYLMDNDDYVAGLTKTLNSAGLFSRADLRYYDKFNRWGYIDQYQRISGLTKEFTFFTKPDLHIYSSPSGGELYEKLAKVPIFLDAYYRYRPVLNELQYSVSRNPFSYLLYNRCKSAIDLPDIEADEENTAANVYGTKISYRKSSLKSNESFDFTVDFEDGRYLDLYMYFKLYDEYMNRKSLGDIAPLKEEYTLYRILSGQTSVYKFVTAEDGETLLYWALLVGVYPKGVPRSALGDIGEDGALKFPVSFKAQFVDDLNPLILSDFNALAKTIPTPSSDNNPAHKVKRYDPDIGGMNNAWATKPLIVKEFSTFGNRPMYKLKWL